MSSSLKLLAKTGDRGLVSNSKTLPLLHECHVICADSYTVHTGRYIFPSDKWAGAWSWPLRANWSRNLHYAHYCVYFHWPVLKQEANFTLCFCFSPETKGCYYLKLIIYPHWISQNRMILWSFQSCVDEVSVSKKYKARSLGIGFPTFRDSVWVSLSFILLRHVEPCLTTSKTHHPATQSHIQEELITRFCSGFYLVKLGLCNKTFCYEAKWNTIFTELQTRIWFCPLEHRKPFKMKFWIHP